MKILIIYASSHGCAAQAAARLQNELAGEVKVQNLKDKTPVFVNAFDRIIIGGSIHAGAIQGNVKKFCRNNLHTLMEKEIGLFICCMDKEKAQQQFDSAFPEALRNHARASGLFGGAFDFERMNFLQKTIIKKISGIQESVQDLNEAAIQEFIKIFNS